MGYAPANPLLQCAVWISLLLRIVLAATFSPILPPAYPLAVRNPYLSSWLPGDLASSLPSSSPKFWFGNDLTWSVIARVNGQAYSLFGVPNALENVTAAAVMGASFTSTRTLFELAAGSSTFTLEFLSPVSPSSLLRQSLPFAYLKISVDSDSLIGSEVQIYSDIDASWTGLEENATCTFSKEPTTSLYQLKPVGGATFSQNTQNQALWGDTVYATRPSQSTLSAASGALCAVRSEFVTNGVLGGSHEGCAFGDVVGFAHDLGRVKGKSSVTFAIGHVRQEVIDFLGNVQTGYYRGTFPDIASAVSFFLDDYLAASIEATKIDYLIQREGELSYGTDYADILALSLRQIYGGIELTIPNHTLDVTDARAFIKEISSNGNINTVDVIYATFPVLYTVTPDYIWLLLKPVFEYMSSSAYTKVYAVHDLGMHYPNATGHNPEGEEMPIEENGNILIMAYAHQLATGSNVILEKYQPLLKRYADYLQTHGMYPEAQLSLNDALGEIANQTNLAMKAASGLACYGHLTSQDEYTCAGKQIADSLYNGRLGTDPDGTYFTIQYGSPTWFLVYNHYADMLFDLGLFPEEAYNATSQFYPTVRKPAGLALAGNLDWGQTNWQGFGAATVGGQTRTMFISDMHAYISNGLNRAPFSDRYWVSDSDSPGGAAGESFRFRARPTLGSHFALLALRGPNRCLQL